MAYSYSIDDPAKNSKRTLAFVLVVIIHVFFFWLLSSGLGAKLVETVVGPVETKIIEELPDEDKEPPPPPPDIEQPPPYVPPPEVSVDLAIDTSNSTAISNATTERPVVQAPPPPKPVEHAVVTTPPSTQGKGARITQPEYPPASRRAGEAGTVQLRCYVQESGKCSEISIVKSSGYDKLDEAAVKEVQRNWRFVPGKVDGKPVAAWHTFAVTFRLTD
ncbi:MAG TPA: energy transducer TonB [Steroidobacteraceae bacterium]